MNCNELEFNKQGVINVTIMYLYKVIAVLILFCSVCLLPVFYPQNSRLLMMFFPSLCIVLMARKCSSYFRMLSKNKFVIYLIAITLFAEFVYLLIVYYYPLGYDFDATKVKDAAAYVAEKWEMNHENSHYFEVYPNNMNIMVLFASIIKLFGTWKSVEVIASILVNFSVLLTGLCVYNITKSRWACIIALIIGHFYIGCCYYSYNAYTHNYGIVFPIFVLYIYTLDVSFYKKVLLVVLVAVVGSEIKVTTLIPFIALCVIGCINQIEKFDVRKTMFATMVILVAFASCKPLRTAIWNSVGYEYDETVATSLPFFFAMGQSTSSQGQYDNDMYILNHRMEGKGMKERNAVFWNKGLVSLKERGLWGNMIFLSRKICMSWGDGTMNAYKTQFSNPVMQKLGFVYSYPRQIVLYVIYILIALAPYVIRDKRIITFYISIVGVFLYLLVFESQSRYIYMYVPMLIALAVIVGKEMLCINKRFVV